MSDTLDSLRRAAASCTNCELYADATRTVFGEGPASAWLMLVGEQPGDREDREGAPFVGPAGRLLDTALERAGIDRDEVYLTNAVKHFRFERDGNRRLHKTPAVGHVRACRPWLDGELAAVAPEVIATLGATAAKALLGSGFRITADRGRPREWEDRQLVPTVHPSAILRTPPERRSEALDALVADLAVVAGLRPARSGRATPPHR
ncbi:UdgX family uracil-DNA binding protein [Pseudonocardia sp.]|jgi:uracil-DNA glycosylase family protein|uniref:UdgX family uracil-DNA binding protein n=1 Tax=Pseudonocardia sp. TaxID=60912 RepID=UPI00263530AE|nr:UdgX family uracil-DNA binding protein [Pseudonocardia sp.]MCW2716693.1 phage polymerase-related protein [Pseudonocardia sp.]MDT7616003.1 uracil-DNA glycosylase [Pseudonocardiales bacterium]